MRIRDVKYFSYSLAWQRTLVGDLGLQNGKARCCPDLPLFGGICHLYSKYQSSDCTPGLLVQDFVDDQPHESMKYIHLREYEKTKYNARSIL